MEKYQRKDIVGIERENERDENYISKTNPQIDHKRTRLNFHFIKPHGSYIAFINQRLKDLAPKRKVKMMLCSYRHSLLEQARNFLQEKIETILTLSFSNVLNFLLNDTAEKILFRPSST